MLELGCGIGLPGVAAAVMGAERVILTDMVSSRVPLQRFGTPPLLLAPRPSWRRGLRISVGSVAL